MPIAWWGPDEADDRERHDAWCAAVGPAVVIDSPADGGAAAVESLVFVSWNTHVGGGDVDALVDALRSGKLTDGIPVSHFVLLLQEVYRDGPEVPSHASNDHSARRIAATTPTGKRTDIVDVAQRHGLALVYVPSMRNGGGTDTKPVSGSQDDAPRVAKRVSGSERVGGPERGLRGPRERRRWGVRGGEAPRVGEDRGSAILSSVPLAEAMAIELPFEQQRRVAAAATAMVSDGSGRPFRVRVASSHLNATAGAGRLFVFASGVRALQARSLAAALAGDDPAVLGSDLNTWADGSREPAVGELTRVFADTEVPRAQATFSLGWQLDYLFFRLPAGWSAVSSRVPNRFGSDHHPLVGRVRID